MKFDVVEGEYSRLTDENYNEFRNDYLHSEMTSREVRNKYNLSKREYSVLTNKIREEEGIQARPRNSAKHYYKQGKNWEIKKQHNGEKFHYYLPCNKFSERQIKEIVKELEKLGWDYIRCSAYLRLLEAIF